MTNLPTQWSKEELHAYLLIYCIHADFKVNPEEISFVKAKVGEQLYTQMHTEFEQDKDFERITKMQSAFERLGYSTTEADQLFAEIKELFLSDGSFDILEQNIYRGLKKILS